jgi:hypothetical protein
MVSGYIHSVIPKVTKSFISKSKAAEHDAKNSPPSTDEVKNGYSSSSTPPTCLHGVVLRQREHFSSVIYKHKMFGT